MYIVTDQIIYYDLYTQYKIMPISSPQLGLYQYTMYDTFTLLNTNRQPNI